MKGGDGQKEVWRAANDSFNAFFCSWTGVILFLLNFEVTWRTFSGLCCWKTKCVCYTSESRNTMPIQAHNSPRDHIQKLGSEQSKQNHGVRWSWTSFEHVVILMFSLIKMYRCFMGCMDNRFMSITWNMNSLTYTLEIDGCSDSISKWLLRWLLSSFREPLAGCLVADFFFITWAASWVFSVFSRWSEAQYYY